MATVTDSFNHAAEASSRKPAGDDPVLAVQMNTICSNVHLLVNLFSGLIDLQQKNCWDVLSHSGFYQGHHAQQDLLCAINDAINRPVPGTSCPLQQ